jgi:hypothetical protein
MWEQIEKLLLVDRSGSVRIQEIIRQGGLAKDFKNVGFAKIILTGCWFIGGNEDKLYMGKKFRTHQEQPCQLRRSQQTML